jgi:RsiW-degrading membrane proteinase PrsW (M82 family)
MTEPFPSPSVSPSVAPAAVALPPADWYPDPADPSRWRWWDGVTWTHHVSSPAGQRPRLPRWLSWPVLVCGLLVVLLLVFIGLSSPWSVVAGLVPLVIVLPALSWLDRVEPEPGSSRIHALLWGATVTVVVASVVNAVVALTAGEVAAMVISAPLVEESAKAMGIVWALRRRDIDGVSDGIVYAGWVALGFAVVEDVTYFAVADVDGALVETVVLRALLTPFAHPLFTFWSGLAIGRAVARNRRVWPSMLWGLGLAVLTHAAWNGTLALGAVTYEVDDDLGAFVLIGGFVLFVVLFGAVAAALYVFRRREQRAFTAAVPGLVLRYAVSPAEAVLFADWRAMLRSRRRLSRARRREFDRMHAALARLASAQRQPTSVDAERERVLVEQLQRAVREYREHGG